MHRHHASTQSMFDLCIGWVYVHLSVLFLHMYHKSWNFMWTVCIGVESVTTSQYIHSELHLNQIFMRCTRMDYNRYSLCVCSRDCDDCLFVLRSSFQFAFLNTRTSSQLVHAHTERHVVSSWIIHLQSLSAFTLQYSDSLFLRTLRGCVCF